MAARSGTLPLPPDAEPSARVQRADFGAWGLRLTTIIYLGAMILIPTYVVLVKGFENGIDSFIAGVTDPASWNAIRLSLSTAFIMTIINTIMGTLTAYVLVRYKFPGKAIFNAFIDLPIAIPTLVTGVMLVLLYGPQTAIGNFFRQTTGQRIIFEPIGIVVALMFITYPFVIRAIQPVLLSLTINQEEAAQTLGASDWTTFWRVIFPAIRPAMISGAFLSFARALGEFGSVIIVAGSIQKTATIYVYAQIEGDNISGATGVSAALILIAFAITSIVDIIQVQAKRRAGVDHA